MLIGEVLIKKSLAIHFMATYHRQFLQHLRYFNETLSNVSLAYPGWVVRIYHNLTMDDDEGWKVLENTIDFGDHIDLCNATELIKKLNLADLFAMTWRWLPLLDETVDILMSRDSDTAVIPREEDAVREWLAISD
ncbi:hypothetical protein OUZ56_017601 [Daphnia magna]|uniref:Uncharacterized protein n=2 Tax=Daphnia magna TaxID=35525 RepID=A0ABR0AT76_9CRUS|nr:hypothetical protein OUZ56_017601 [Daphnia magna]